MQEVLDRHRETAALLLAPAVPSAAPPDSPQTARLDSHLSHNALLKRPFLDGGLEILTALLASSEVRLVIPDPARLDAETVWLLDKFLQRQPEAFPAAAVYLGEEDGQLDLDGPDERGLRWGPSPLDLASLRLLLRRHPRAVMREAASAKAGSSASLEPLEQDEDGCLLARFEAAAGAPDAELCRAVLALVRRAFAGHAFEAALLWGLRLLERCPRLTPLDEAEVHHIVALSAHNRQFRSAGNERLVPFLESHLDRALELETRPDWRSALLYRRAVTLGRRQGRLEDALAAADEAIEIADSSPLPRAASTYLRAWALNIRALLWLRRKDPGQAAADIEEALRTVGAAREALPSAPPAERAVWERDLFLSWNVLAGNRVGLARMAHDEEAVTYWRTQEEQGTAEHPEFALYEAADWVPAHRDFLRFDLALEAAERGLDLALRENHVLWEYIFLTQVADLSYRLRRVERAVEACAAARAFVQEYGNAAFLGSLDLLHAEALGRAGRWPEAHRLLNEVLATPGLSAKSRLEIHGVRARLAAAAGEANLAEKAAEAAIEFALESGRRQALILAAVAAGVASEHLGRQDQARDAYRRALDIARGAGAKEIAASAADLLEAHLGRWRHDPESRSSRVGVVAALGLLPKALRHAHGWWLLAPLAQAVETVRRQQPALLEDPDLAPALEQLHTAGAQRSDVSLS